MSQFLIIGGSGFIGRHFYEALRPTSPTILDLKSPEFLNDSARNYIKGDAQSARDISNAIHQSRCDIILHLAAAHQDFGISRDDYFKMNEGSAKATVDAAKENGIKTIVFFSSVAVYGDSHEASSEEKIPTPTNAYGESKLAAEHVFNEWAKEDSKRQLLIIRPCVVYGEYNFANMYRLIRQIQKRMYLHVGSGKNVKSIAYVKNLVDATLYSIKKLKPGAFTYNYSDEPQLTSRDISECIAKEFGISFIPNVPLTFGKALTLPFDVFIKLTGVNLPVSTARLVKFCTPTVHRSDKIRRSGFTPKYSNIEGIKNMVHWYIDHRRLSR